MNETFEKLVTIIAMMPGIGPRHATRIALSMLDWDPEKRNRLLGTLKDVFDKINFCENCFFVSEENMCNICKDPKRDRNRIAVVENAPDLISFERVGIYKGLYHVLGGTINPSQGKMPSNLKIRNLIQRVQEHDHKSELEIILATGSHVHGETTALYLIEELKPLDVKITRLARGLASGSTIEYADPLTLTHALKERRQEV